MTQIIEKPARNVELLQTRDLPAYTVVDAARYLSIPVGTLSSWLRGRSYPTELGKRFFEPLIQRPLPEQPQLSFTNLVEAHVLRVIRQEHNIRLDKVRKALDYLEQAFNLPHPLARVEFKTDGVDLFVRFVGNLINASQASQLAMEKTLQHLLKRIEWDEQGIASKLYPFTRSANAQDSPKVLVIDARISFGRPTLLGTGIPTAILAKRYKAGESIDDLADDYGCERLSIEEAIRCELVMQRIA
jgi:uncharacterized protein (DUF433 family)